MRANFPACLAFTIGPGPDPGGQEGGLTNDQKDPGGLTNFGISKRAYPDEDIVGMTRDRAAAIYLRDYWIPSGGDEWPSGLDMMVFDEAVNAGVGRSAILLQELVGVDADGMIGPKTLAAVNAAISDGGGTARVLGDLAQAQREYYTTRPGFFRYSHNWLNRVSARLQAALEMAASP